MSIVNDQLFTPLLAYVSILNTLSSYERQNGAASYAVRGNAMVKKYGKVDFEDLFTGDTPSIGAAAYVVGPINFLLRNAFEDVDIEGLNLEIDASEHGDLLFDDYVDQPLPPRIGDSVINFQLARSLLERSCCGRDDSH